MITTDIMCDECATKWVHGCVEPKINKTEAKRVAKKQGWSFMKGRQYCDTCTRKRMESDR